MDVAYADYYTKEVMLILIREAVILEFIVVMDETMDENHANSEKGY